MPIPRISLAHLPTPLLHLSQLDRLVGTEVWIKSDDCTAGAAGGNKIRKLEYLLCDALAHKASHVITCGGEQSNHARATAICARQLGMEPVLLLRTRNPAHPPSTEGNILIDRMLGARLKYITREQYADRNALLAQLADELLRSGARPYVIPEGGSNGLGALGYVDAMGEVRRQLDLGMAGNVTQFDSIVMACGSGGTAAGVALGAHIHGIAPQVDAMAVCDSSHYFHEVINRIVVEAWDLDPRLGPTVSLHVHDTWKGPDYAVASDEQKAFLCEVAQRTGLILDPVYTGKALFGLSRLSPKPDRVLFIHTGGLPGLLAQYRDFEWKPVSAPRESRSPSELPP